MSESSKNNPKIKTYVGFAIKSNKVVWGVDNIIENRRPPALVIIDTQLSDNSKERLAKYTDTYSVKVIIIDELSELVSKPNCKAIAIKDKNLSHAILSVKETL